MFVDGKTGNCASCHYPGAGINGSTGIFTDFSFEAIGVPRNTEVPANADPAYFDLGLCGPLRTDHATPSSTPAPAGCSRPLPCATSRRAAVFFHNGFAHSLEQALRFTVSASAEAGVVGGVLDGAGGGGGAQRGEGVQHDGQLPSGGAGADALLVGARVRAVDDAGGVVREAGRRRPTCAR